MTVGELRKALDGVADDTPVAVGYDAYPFKADDAAVTLIKPIGEWPGLEFSGSGTPYFLIA